MLPVKPPQPELNKKPLPARIALRSDELSCWYDKNPRLLPGEVAISYEISSDAAGQQTKCHYSIKAGAFKPGQKTPELYNWRELPFIEANIIMSSFNAEELVPDQLSALAQVLSSYLGISQKMDMSTFDASKLSASQISVLAQVLSSQMAEQIEISVLTNRIIQGISPDQMTDITDKFIDNMGADQLSSLGEKLHLSSVLSANSDTIGKIVDPSKSAEQQQKAIAELQQAIYLAMLSALSDQPQSEIAINMRDTMNKVVNTDTIEHGEDAWLLNGGDCDDYNNSLGTIIDGNDQIIDDNVQ